MSSLIEPNDSRRLLFFDRLGEEHEELREELRDSVVGEAFLGGPVEKEALRIAMDGEVVAADMVESRWSRGLYIGERLPLSQKGRSKVRHHKGKKQNCE